MATIQRTRIAVCLLWLAMVGCGPAAPVATVSEDTIAGRKKTTIKQPVVRSEASPGQTPEPKSDSTPEPIQFPSPTQTVAAPVTATASPTASPSPGTGASPTPTPGASATPAGLDPSALIYEGDFVATVLAGGKVGTLRDGIGEAASVGRNVDGVGLAFEAAYPGSGSAHLLFTDGANNQVRQIDMADRAVSRVAGSDREAGIQTVLGFPSGLAVDTLDHTVVLTETENMMLGRVFRNGNGFDATPGGLLPIAGLVGAKPYQDGQGIDDKAKDITLATFAKPRGLALLGRTLYVADTDNHTIRAINLVRPYAVTFVAGGKGVAGRPAKSDAEETREAARFDLPTGLAIGGTPSAPRLFVADRNNHCIRSIDLAKPDGKVTVVAGFGLAPGGKDGPAVEAAFDQPMALAADAAGNVYVGEANNHRVRRINAADRKVVTLSGQAGRGSTLGKREAAGYHLITGLALEQSTAGKVTAIYAYDTGPASTVADSPGPRIVRLTEP